MVIIYKFRHCLSLIFFVILSFRAASDLNSFSRYLIQNNEQIGWQNRIFSTFGLVFFFNKQTWFADNADNTCFIGTHTFNGPLSGTTRVVRYQKGKTNLDFTAARDSEWQWHQLGRMQVCISLQADNHASTPPLSFFTFWMPFLPLNQQCQSTEGNMFHR